MGNPLILAVTGHRPHKLPASHLDLRDFAREKLRATQPSTVLTGMALGWDQIIAEACRLERIPYVAYVPGGGQERLWSPSQSEWYFFLLSKAERVVFATLTPCDDAAFEIRNRRMVDDCTLLASFWDGSLGGTANCVRYAVDVGRPYSNWYVEWSLQCQK